MKKLFLTLGLGLSLSTYSQIVVKETAKDSVVWNNKLTGLPQLVHFYGTDTDRYTLYYKNLEYQYITDVDYISLGSKENAIEFFNVLKNSWTDKKEINFELDEKLWFVYSKANMIYISSSGTNFWLTNNNVDKILEALK